MSLCETHRSSPPPYDGYRFRLRVARCGGQVAPPILQTFVAPVFASEKLQLNGHQVDESGHPVGKVGLMAEINVTDWSELNEVLFGDTWNPAIKRFRSNFAYRGLNRSELSHFQWIDAIGRPLSKYGKEPNSNNLKNTHINTLLSATASGIAEWLGRFV